MNEPESFFRKISDPILEEIQEEFIRASRKHGPMNSSHEAYAVLLEEVDELWDEVKKDGTEERKRAEFIQIAAMALRAIVDLKL